MTKKVPKTFFFEKTYFKVQSGTNGLRNPVLLKLIWICQIISSVWVRIRFMGDHLDPDARGTVKKTKKAEIKPSVAKPEKPKLLGNLEPEKCMRIRNIDN